jgi:hypothetical protein
MQAWRHSRAGCTCCLTLNRDCQAGEVCCQSLKRWLREGWLEQSEGRSEGASSPCNALFGAASSRHHTPGSRALPATANSTPSALGHALLSCRRDGRAPERCCRNPGTTSPNKSSAHAPSAWQPQLKAHNPERQVGCPTPAAAGCKSEPAWQCEISRRALRSAGRILHAGEGGAICTIRRRNTSAGRLAAAPLSRHARCSEMAATRKRRGGTCCQAGSQRSNAVKQVQQQRGRAANAKRRAEAPGGQSTPSQSGTPPRTCQGAAAAAAACSAAQGPPH